MASFGFLLLALHPIRWRTAHACWSNAGRKSYEKITRYSLSSSDSCQVICWLRKEHKQLLLLCSRNPCAVPPLPPQPPQQNAKFWNSVGSKHLILHLPCLFKYLATLNVSLHCVDYVFLSTVRLPIAFYQLYYFVRNFFNLVGLEQWYFSLIWNTCMWKIQNVCG